MSVKRSAKSGNRPDLYLFSTTIMVSDRKKSVDWYTRKLGLEVIQDLGHWVTVGHEGWTGLIHLCQGSEIDEPLAPGNQGITLHVRGDFRATVAELARSGVKLDLPVTKRPWGMYARIVDPDGNVLTLNPED